MLLHLFMERSMRHSERTDFVAREAATYRSAGLKSEVGPRRGTVCQRQIEDVAVFPGAAAYQGQGNTGGGP